MKLHIGCGIRDFGFDWVHIDGSNYPHIKYHDVTNLSQFRNNTVDLIYSAHLLEYFDREEVVILLNEWKRVLKPEGRLRLAVPDFRKMMSLYIDKDFRLENFLGPIFGKMPMGTKTIYHRTTYDFDSLSHLLMEVGFKNVERYDWRKTEHARFDDHSQAYMNPKGDKENGTLISLNVECIK